jgi:hypothetical protein
MRSPPFAAPGIWVSGSGDPAFPVASGRARHLGPLPGPAVRPMESAEGRLTRSVSLHPLWLGRPQRARRWCVDALVAVIPADAITRRWRRPHHLLDNARTGPPLGRLGLDLHPISGVQLHALTSCVASPSVIPEAGPHRSSSDLMRSPECPEWSIPPRRISRGSAPRTPGACPSLRRAVAAVAEQQRVELVVGQARRRALELRLVGDQVVG